MTDSGAGMIAVPRPKPDEVVTAVCDADGAVCWMVSPKRYFADDDGFAGRLLPHLADGLERAHSTA